MWRESETSRMYNLRHLGYNHSQLCPPAGRFLARNLPGENLLQIDTYFCVRKKKKKKKKKRSVVVDVVDVVKWKEGTNVSGIIDLWY